MKNAILFTDGAARGNPGPAGAGFLLKDDAGAVVFAGSKYLGEATNNQAEYVALVEGLENALRLGFDVLSIRMDSELIVKQIKGLYRVKNEGLKPHFEKAKKMLGGFKKYDIAHVPRENNKEADKLANIAIDTAL